MPTPPKRLPSTSVRKPREAAADRSATQRSFPSNRAEKHIGATEDQVSPTMPPSADDDEPKQG